MNTGEIASQRVSRDGFPIGRGFYHKRTIATFGAYLRSFRGNDVDDVISTIEGTTSPGNNRSNGNSHDNGNVKASKNGRPLTIETHLTGHEQEGDWDPNFPKAVGLLILLAGLELNRIVGADDLTQQLNQSPVTGSD